MRITEYQQDAIVQAVRDVDPRAKIWLFGSRADDTKKGGDIDVAILSSTIDLMQKIKIHRDILDKIGDQKIDIVISKDGSDPFFQFAKETGIPIYGNYE
ncbi:hypothetical protein AGMMS50212_03200 [Spirochaetia bacterium]|nr:hypothetical protein AGMMS50212_03200 [Spirochaetia bacterium]